MPITSEGSQTITVFDESGNGASTLVLHRVRLRQHPRSCIEDLERSSARTTWQRCRRSGRCRGEPPPPEDERLAMPSQRPIARSDRRTAGRSLRPAARASRTRRWRSWRRCCPAWRSPRTEAYQPPHDQPGPAADRLLFNSFFVDRAPLDIEAGNMDLYLYGLKTEAAQELRGTEGVELIDAPATTRLAHPQPGARPRRASSTPSPSPRCARPCSTSSTASPSPRTSTVARRSR